MIALAALLAAAALPSQFEPMRFLLGHCWRGEFASGEVDTHCFEPVYDGRLIRDTHEVTGGKAVYRGETLYNWNGGAARVEYTYWNSAGGVSRGTMVAKTDRLDFGDETYRGADGRERKISTYWRRAGEDAYEAVTVAGDVSGSRVVRYARVAPGRVEALADGTRTLVNEIRIEASPAEVWAAVSTPEGWRTWAVPFAAASGEFWETSYDARAALGTSGNIRQRTIASLPGRMHVFRTVQAPPGFPHADAYYGVTNFIELIPDGSGTRVRLTAAGYPAGPAGDELIGFFRTGNQATLEQLRDRFVNGPIDWSKRTATAK